MPLRTQPDLPTHRGLLLTLVLTLPAAFTGCKTSSDEVKARNSSQEKGSSAQLLNIPPGTITVLNGSSQCQLSNSLAADPELLNAPQHDPLGPTPWQIGAINPVSGGTGFELSPAGYNLQFATALRRTNSGIGQNVIDPHDHYLVSADSGGDNPNDNVAPSFLRWFDGQSYNFLKKLNATVYVDRFGGEFIVTASPNRLVLKRLQGGSVDEFQYFPTRPGFAFRNAGDSRDSYRLIRRTYQAGDGLWGVLQLVRHTSGHIIEVMENEVLRFSLAWEIHEGVPYLASILNHDYGLSSALFYELDEWSRLNDYPDGNLPLRLTAFSSSEPSPHVGILWQSRGTSMKSRVLGYGSLGTEELPRPGEEASLFSGRNAIASSQPKPSYLAFGIIYRDPLTYWPQFVSSGNKQAVRFNCDGLNLKVQSGRLGGTQPVSEQDLGSFISGPGSTTISFSPEGYTTNVSNSSSPYSDTSYAWNTSMFPAYFQVHPTEITVKDTQGSLAGKSTYQYGSSVHPFIPTKVTSSSSVTGSQQTGETHITYDQKGLPITEINVVNGIVVSGSRYKYEPEAYGGNRLRQADGLVVSNSACRSTASSVATLDSCWKTVSLSTVQLTSGTLVSSMFQHGSKVSETAVTIHSPIAPSGPLPPINGPRSPSTLTGALTGALKCMVATSSSGTAESCYDNRGRRLRFKNELGSELTTSFDESTGHLLGVNFGASSVLTPTAWNPNRSTKDKSLANGRSSVSSFYGLDDSGYAETGGGKLVPNGSQSGSTEWNAKHSRSGELNFDVKGPANPLKEVIQATKVNPDVLR